jgi:ABC-type transport system involved in cytochrome c biogenesis permease subunit
MMNLVLSVMMLAAFALLAGAVVLWRRGVRRQAGLMVLLAVVAIVNVLIWTVPDAAGEAPVDRLDQSSEGAD